MSQHIQHHHPQQPQYVHYAGPSNPAAHPYLQNVAMMQAQPQHMPHILHYQPQGMHQQHQHQPQHIPPQIAAPMPMQHMPQPQASGQASGGAAGVSGAANGPVVAQGDWTKDLVQLAKQAELKKHALTLQLHTAHILSAHASLEQKSKAIQDLKEQKNKYVLLDSERQRLLKCLQEINSDRDQADIAQSTLESECHELQSKITQLSDGEYAIAKNDVDRLRQELGQAPLPSLQQTLEERTTQYLTERRLNGNENGDSSTGSKRSAPNDDAEIPLIDALIQRKVEAIGDIDKGIEQLEDSLAALKAEREANKIFIQNHQAMVAPIKRLPPDILSTVFLACLPTVAVGSTETPMGPDHPAVVISHVCRRWRSLAFDTPLLWSRIQISLPWVNPQPYHHLYGEVPVNNAEIAALFDSAVQRQYEMASVWLSRSKRCPLSISVEASEGAAGLYILPQMRTIIRSILKSLERLVDLLRSESKRWSQIRFRFAIDGSKPSQSQLNRLLFIAPRDLPILSKAVVVINTLKTIGPVDEFTLLPYPAVAPAISWGGIVMGTLQGEGLRSLTLACPKTATDLKVLQVNWHGLTELSLGTYKSDPGTRGGIQFSSDEALTLLKLCPNLERCKLSFGDGSGPAEWDTAVNPWAPPDSPTGVEGMGQESLNRTGVCCLPRLHSLTLREYNGTTDALAAALELPSLRSLSQTRPWDDWPEGGRSHRSPLASWVRRFGHTITSIDFKHVGIPQHMVEQSLADLPNLISLTIRSPFSESGNAEVTEFGSIVTVLPGCLCPKLEELDLNSSKEPEVTQLVFSEASVLDFLAGRAKASRETVSEASRFPKLRFASVQFADPKEMDLEQELLRRGFNMIDGFVGEWHYPTPPIPPSYLMDHNYSLNNYVAGEF
ncbi:hypothetical protein MD484_g3457, partial [Candolleomyces efflorescens]